MVRGAKKAATEKAQRFINVKNATEQLQLLLCANFDSKQACFCTFTFTEDQIPANRKHVKAIFSGYLAKLRKEWRRSDRHLRYIYTVEGCSMEESPEAQSVEGNAWELTPWKDRDRWAQLDHQAAHEEPEAAIRLHVHCFLLLEREDYETVKALWPYGRVFINHMRVNDLTTFHRLAAYVTKESRDGKTGNGARSYTPCLGLQQPERGGHWCNEYEGLELPKEAEEISSGAERNEIYGTSVEYIYYRMPKSMQQPQPYKSKGKLSRKRRQKPAIQRQI